MAQPAFTVLDDFYDSPHAIRDLALTREYTKYGGVNYPGAQAVVHELDWTPVRARLRSFVHDDVDAPCPKSVPFPQGMFRLALAADSADRPDGVHQDIQRWSGVIYLSRPQDCQGGVTFYRHRETGATSVTPEWERAVFGELLGRPDSEVRPLVKQYMRQPQHWEELDRISMRFNRAVLLMAQCFHASAGLFGTSPKSGRLTQHFEFYSPQDAVSVDPANYEASTVPAAP